MTHSLVNAQGQVAYGHFDDTLASVNGRDATYKTPMGRQASAFARHFHYKQFQYFGVISERYLLGCALADTAWLGLAFVYLYDVKADKLEEWTWRSPLARALTMSTSPREGMSEFKQGKVHIRLGYAEQQGKLTKTLQLDTPALQVQTEIDERHFSPMSLCTRTGVNGFTYANKVAGVPVSGELTLGNETLSLESIGAFGHHDFSAGYMRRETFWNWACTSAEVEGHALGLNVSCGVNETSYSENCYWLDGQLHALGGIAFEYNRHNLLLPWQIHDQNNQLSLTFQPAGEHVEQLNLGLFASNFHQLFGHFHGHIDTPEGKLTLSAIPGFVEEQYAKW